MNVTICIIIGIIALIVGFALGRSSVEPTVSFELIEKINHAMGTENQTLKDENETLRKKNLFFSDWFIRSYIEQYDLKNLALKKYQIYTVDALADLRKYAKTALINFKNTWNSEACNEQTIWIKEYLEELISKIDSILEFGSDVIDRDNEDAFSRFFVRVETSLFFDRIAKENGSKLEKLTYREPAVEHDDLC